MVLNINSLKCPPLYLAERGQDQLNNTTVVLMNTLTEEVLVDS